MTFELRLQKNHVHVNVLEGRENLIERGHTATMPLGCPHTIDDAVISWLSTGICIVHQVQPCWSSYANTKLSGGFFGQAKCIIPGKDRLVCLGATTIAVFFTHLQLSSLSYMYLCHTGDIHLTRLAAVQLCKCELTGHQLKVFRELGTRLVHV